MGWAPPWICRAAVALALLGVAGTARPQAPAPQESPPPQESPAPQESPPPTPARAPVPLTSPAAAPAPAPAASLPAAPQARPGAAHREAGDDPLLALVNGHELRLSDVFDSIATLSLGDQIDARSQLTTYVEALVNEEMLFQWALRNNFDEDRQLRQDVKDLVVRRLIERNVRARIRVTESDARDYYERFPSLVRGEHVRVRRILLPRREQCERLMARIDSDEAFAAAARTYSLDADTREAGGDAGLMMRGENPPDTYELSFFEMRVGEMRVFDVPDGCMLVRSIHYTNPPLPPFAAVRDDLMQYLRNRQELGLVDRLFQRAGKDSKVERFYGDGGASEPIGALRTAPGAAAPGGTSR